MGQTTTSTKKYSGTISASDPATGIIQVTTAGGVVHVSVQFVPALFRWPQVAEIWTVYQENGTWILGDLLQDTNSDAPIAEMQPGEAQINASTVIDSAGNQFVTQFGRMAWRVIEVPQSATPVIDTDNADIIAISELAQPITSMTANLTGTPNPGDILWIEIVDNGTAQGITWGAKFAATNAGPALPTTTVSNDVLTIAFRVRAITPTVWSCWLVA
jgi:hypothetical protein